MVEDGDPRGLGLTALHRGAMGSHGAVLGALLAAGADPTIRTAKCRSEPAMGGKVAYEVGGLLAAWEGGRVGTLLGRFRGLNSYGIDRSGQGCEGCGTRVRAEPFNGACVRACVGLG